MTEAVAIIDSTYRWSVVVVLAVVFATCILPGAYRKGFPRNPPLYGIGVGLLLVCYGVVGALMFRESITDAFLLRAQFGFPVPDSGIFGYGWGFIFGYTFILSGVAILVIGNIMVALGKVPPWISNTKRR